jgi:hypothetical protein
LSWGRELASATNDRRKLAILWKLSGTTWEASGKILSKVYQHAIQPHLKYWSAAWCPESNTALQELDKVQNQAFNVRMGAIKSTPIVEIETMGRT